MYIHNKAAAAFYKLTIGTISLVLEWFLLWKFGCAAFRLFPLWVLLLTAVYFLISALLLAINHKKISGKNPAPVFEGMIIVSYLLMIAVALLSSQYHFALPHLDTWLVWMLCFILPVLTLFDWLLFVKKGRWRIMMPFYALALPACYVATMIFTADFLPSNAEFIYPLEIFNYYEFGLWDFLEWILAACVGILLTGYVLYLLDFIMSGKLAKNVVMPHIQVIEVEEEVIIEQPTSPKNSKSAKLEPEAHAKDKPKVQQTSKPPIIEKVSYKVSKDSHAARPEHPHKKSAAQRRKKRKR